MEENDLDRFQRGLLLIHKQDKDFQANLVTFSLGQVFYVQKDYEKSLYFFSRNYKCPNGNKTMSLLYMGKIMRKIHNYPKSLLTFEKLL